MPTTVKPDRLLIVDGHAYAYRAFHAIRHLHSPAGAPTNAIYGFIKMLGKMQTQLGATHVVVVWDGGLDAGRTADHPEYKTNRPAMPPDLERQLDGIVHYLEASGIRSLCRDAVEADDWIAAIARQQAARVPVVIASSDKDFMQLVSDRVGLLNPNDKSEKVWGCGEVRAKTGVSPEQVVDWLALIGDSVDNIPGVPGVGPKTATELLQRFSSIDGIYAHLAEVKSERVRGSLTAAEGIVRRNQQLIRLREEQPAVELSEFALRPPNSERLAALYEEWGFKTMLAEVRRKQPEQGVLL